MDTTRVQQLIEKKSLTAEERREIRECADSLGISYVIKKGCNRTCYEKLLLKIYERVGDVVTANVSLDGYVLKNPSNAFRLPGGKIINNETVKNINVGDLHPFVLQYFFKKA